MSSSSYQFQSNNRSYQRIVQNGNTIECINGKCYVNGIEVSTGKVKRDYYVLTAVISILTFLVGTLVGHILWIT